MRLLAVRIRWGFHGMAWVRKVDDRR
jgi:hypothetical protein